MGEPLRLPPLVEAVCEFKFASSTEAGWDLTLPGRLYERIGEEFSVRSQVSDLSIQLQMVPSPTPQTIRGPERLQLKRPDGSAMVQIGQDLLVINYLKPYKGWKVFSELIAKVFENYVGLLDSQFSLIRIGLRYINHLPIPQNESFEVSDFLSVIPQFTGSIDLPLSSFYQRYEIVYSDEDAVLIHQSAIAKTSNSEFVILLDLDFGSERVDNFLDVDQVLNWLEKAHKNIGSAFESSLNSKYYSSMKG